jgi:hypothetical protein
LQRMAPAWAGWAAAWVAGNKPTVMDVAGTLPPHPLIKNEEAPMETTGDKEEEDTTVFNASGMSAKCWVLIVTLVLLCLALCVVVFAGGTGALGCNLQNGGLFEEEGVQYKRCVTKMHE